MTTRQVFSLVPLIASIIGVLVNIADMDWSEMLAFLSIFCFSLHFLTEKQGK